MKVIKNINNNVAICADASGHEIIVFAKGIGFKKPPYEITLDKIERTFYDVDPQYTELLLKVDEKIIDIAIDIKEYANKMNIVTGFNLIYALVDHISYSLERHAKGIYFNLPIANDIRLMFENEMNVGLYGLGLINEKLGVLLPKEEASYIALNIINSETEVTNKQKFEDLMISEITNIINVEMNIEIDVDSVNYSRFVSHMRYLLKRISLQDVSEYKDLLDTIYEKNHREYLCALKIKEYLEKNNYGPFSKDEVLFLSLHILRLCNRNV